MPSVGFEPTISAGERTKTYALDRAATGTGTSKVFNRQYYQLYREDCLNVTSAVCRSKPFHTFHCLNRKQMVRSETQRLKGYRFTGINLKLQALCHHRGSFCTKP
jgi:hypothetical protein